MFRLMLAYFGYIKIPAAAIKLSIEQELFLQKMIFNENNEKGKTILQKYLIRQKALTSLLKSGRL